MSSTPTPRAWRCEVCGYVHRGATIPEGCPVCGAAGEVFEPFAEDVAPAAPVPGAEKWKCLLCDYISKTPKAPDPCPVCGAEADCFEALRLPEAAAAPVVSAAPGCVVIVGGGIAGVTAIETMVERAPETGIVLVSHERALPYYRLNLTRYLAGDIRQEELPIHPESWYAQHGVTLHLGADVAALQPGERSLTLRDGQRLDFDRLILAVGSHPYIPPLAGIDLDGVTAIRTAGDVEALLESVSVYGPCVCIGGGVLGIETAGALARRGVDVTLLESHEWLMPRQLNRAAAGLLQQHIETLGITLKREARSVELLGRRRVKGVRLSDGSIVPAGIVVITTGVRPNTSLARQAGLEVNRGIVVDNHLRTSCDAVYAAGDAAEHNGVIYGAWGASLAQGAIAGMNALGGDAVFGGVPRSNTLKVLDLDLLSIGQFEPEDGSYVVIDGNDDGAYQHFVFRDGVMVGAILLGDTATATAVRHAVEQRRDFSGILQHAVRGSDIVQVLRD